MGAVVGGLAELFGPPFVAELLHISRDPTFPTIWRMLDHAAFIISLSRVVYRSANGKSDVVDLLVPMMLKLNADRLD